MWWWAESKQSLICTNRKGLSSMNISLTWIPKQGVTVAQQIPTLESVYIPRTYGIKCKLILLEERLFHNAKNYTTFNLSYSLPQRHLWAPISLCNRLLGNAPKSWLWWSWAFMIRIKTLAPNWHKFLEN